MCIYRQGIIVLLTKLILYDNQYEILIPTYFVYNIISIGKLQVKGQ